MPINPDTLKQMKSGTLKSLNLQRQPMDERDWRTVSEFVRTTTTLERIDLTYMGGALEMLVEPLKQNRSVTALQLNQIMQDHNMPVLVDILKANAGITQLNLDNCYLQYTGLSKLANYMKLHPTITHLSLEGVNIDQRTEKPRLETVTKTLKDNPNILEFSPPTAETQSVCIANKAAAEMLVHSAMADAALLSPKEIENIKLRLPSFTHVAETDIVRDRKEIAQLFVNIEDAAAAAGISFAIPQKYAFAAAELPRPFTASKDKVDFAKAASPDDLGNGGLYKAVEAGQVDQLVSFLAKHGKKLTAADCLVKPAGKRENLIELIARQGKLPAVVTVGNWTGDPRGLKAVAAVIPAREWQRQLKGTELDTLLSQVNAASFKEARRPQQQARPG